MAVQAQYPFNLLLFNRSDHQQQQEERKDMEECTQHQQHLQPGFNLDHSPVFFTNAAGAAGGVTMNGINTRKRGRDGSAAAAVVSSFQVVPQNQMNGLFSQSIQSQAYASLNHQLLQSHHQLHQHPPLVSTGLRLSFDEENNTKDLAYLVNQQREEIDQYLTAQGEQLRRTLANKRQQHYRALLAAAEESASRRLKEKEAELDRAARRTADLEDKIARLRTESLTWQAKAMTGQATAASLHVQIQQAAAAANPNSDGESAAGAEDAASAHVDPDRVQADWRRACRVCHVSAVSVVVLPCRHLCLCSACDAAVADSDAVCCPVCHAGRTGSVQVFLS